MLQCVIVAIDSSATSVRCHSHLNAASRCRWFIDLSSADFATIVIAHSSFSCRIERVLRAQFAFDYSCE